MSAFNRVLLSESVICANCGAHYSVVVQFKFGDVWQHTYSLNEPIRWGGNDEGRPGLGRVLANGYPEGCPRCGTTLEHRYDLVIEDDQITGAIPAPIDTEFSTYGNESFVVSDPDVASRG